MRHTGEDALGGVRLIAIDMDGTLLMSDHRTVHPANIDAIRRADAAGVRVCISTGRMMEDASDFVRRLGLPCMIAAANGARASTGPMPGAKMLLRHDLTPRDAHAALDLLLPTGLTVHAFEDGAVNTAPGDVGRRYHLVQRGLIAERLGEAAVREAAGRGVMKIFAVGARAADGEPDARVGEAMARVRQALPHLQITSSMPDNVEVMAADAGKGAALAHIARWLGLAREQVMAIGDAGNDLSMLAYAGQSVAMENATAQVRAACRYVTGNHDEGGVGQMIERVLREKG